LGGFAPVRVPDNVRKAVESFSAQIDLVNKVFTSPTPGGAAGSAGPPLVYTPPTPTQRLGRLLQSLESWSAAPSQSQREEFGELVKAFEGIGEKVKSLEQGAADLEKLMREAQMPYLPNPAPATGGGTRRGGEDGPEPVSPPSP
jgi:hypothetical protein